MTTKTNIKNQATLSQGTVSKTKNTPKKKGSANLISPAQILQNIVTKKISGKLTISDPHDESIFWKVYVGNGQIHFATSAMGQKERLEYFLQWYYPELEFNGQNFKSDYHQVCQYWKSGQLSVQQVRKLLFWLTQDALIQLLALPKAVFKFEKTVGLDPILLSVSLRELVLPMRGVIGQWQKLQPEISSPFKRVIIKNIKELPKLLWETIKDIEFLKALCKVLSKNPCLYEAAKYLKVDTLGLAALLQPLVRAGVVEIQPYYCPKTQPKPIIACIDDSKTVQRSVKMVLESNGYQVLNITEPAKALSTMAKYKPDLVLMDINMPEINGYELARMLRQSKQFQTVPIVMLTGRDGLIDKMRAQMVGANDYITKPVPPQMLFNIVKQNLQQPRQLKRKPTQEPSLSGSKTVLQMA
jgi:twitching motility two-component system response regulator PilG